jgi:methionine-rich copper-binding protein CopC
MAARGDEAMKRLLTTAVVSLALGAGAAAAHPRLIAASPPAGGRVAAPPQLRLSFSETLIGKFSQLSLADGAGHRVPLGPSALSPDHKQLVASLRVRLRPGMYRLSWRAVSTDTHRVQGGYAFSVTR